MCLTGKSVWDGETPPIQASNDAPAKNACCKFAGWVIELDENKKLKTKPTRIDEYITEYDGEPITLGRPTGETASNCHFKGLSTYKGLSRKHASLLWNPKTQLWTIKPLSSSGIIVDGAFYKPGDGRTGDDYIPLNDKSCIRMSAVCVQFFTPRLPMDSSGSSSSSSSGNNGSGGSSGNGTSNKTSGSKYMNLVVGAFKDIANGESLTKQQVMDHACTVGAASPPACPHPCMHASLVFPHLAALATRGPFTPPLSPTAPAH